MTANCKALLEQLAEIKKHYDEDDWSLHDLQNDIEDVLELAKQISKEEL